MTRIREKCTRTDLQSRGIICRHIGLCTVKSLDLHGTHCAETCVKPTRGMLLLVMSYVWEQKLQLVSKYIDNIVSLTLTARRRIFARMDSMVIQKDGLARLRKEAKI